MVLFELLQRGGWMMYVLLGISVVASAIVLDRVYVLVLKARVNIPAFMGQIQRLVEARQYREALAQCDLETQHPIPSVIKAGLARADRREKEIERAMEEEMLRAIPRVQRGLGLLGLLGNVATLLGLLGTIFGLIKAFSGVSAASAAARQQVLAEGISIAMYTTAFGLIVAVPILFAHQLLSTKVENLLLQIEECALALLRSLAGRLREVRTPPPNTAPPNPDLEEVA